MGKIAAVLIVMFAFFVAAPLSVSAQEVVIMTEITMLRVNSIIEKYGCVEKGVYNRKADVVVDVEFEDTEKVYAIEGDEKVLDTPEEFVTAAWFAKVTIKDVKAAEEISKELPQGKEGALKLCAMWTKKWTEAHFIEFKSEEARKAQKESYLKIIDTIAKKNGISPAEINKYFAEAMKGEIDRVVDEAYSTVEFKLQNFKDEINVVKIIRLKNGTYDIYARNGGDFKKLGNVSDVEKDLSQFTAIGFTPAQAAECKEAAGPLRIIWSIADLAPIVNAKKLLYAFYQKPSPESYIALAYGLASFKIFRMENIELNDFQRRCLGITITQLSGGLAKSLAPVVDDIVDTYLKDKSKVNLVLLTDIKGQLVLNSSGGPVNQVKY
ncbi:MAG: hypothetical protein JW904_05170 [Spirochaetales bacterium]|nr:hypothetical protein [Spirochaetales bacterium]